MVISINKCLLAFFVFVNFQLLAQDFEGVLTYKVDLEVLSNLKKMGVSKESLISKLQEEGSWAQTQRITYKGGFYRIDLETSPKVWSIYRSDSNNLYTFQESSDICSITDASVDLEMKMTDQGPNVSLLDTLVNLDDKACKIVRVKWKSGYFEYYFSENYLHINSDLYKKHFYDGWNAYIKIANCLPVKIVKVVNGMMKVTFVLSDVKSGKIDTNLFLLPTLTPVEEHATASKNRRVMKIKVSN